MDRAIFRRELKEALTYVRDHVHLRSMHLASVLVPDALGSQRGWELSSYLLEAIEKLQPSPGRRQSWQWCRYDILNLRYVNGLAPEEVADRLVISRREFYRRWRRALDELADFLWADIAERVLAEDRGEPGDTPAPGKDGDRAELLLREAASMLQSDQSCSLPEIWQSVVRIISPLLAKRSIALHAELPSDLSNVALSSEILKQFLLGLLGESLQDPHAAGISVTVAAIEQGLGLFVTVRRNPPRSAAKSHLDTIRDTLPQRASSRLALLQGVCFQEIEVGLTHVACRAVLPVVSSRTVLVVEDDEEVGALFALYLTNAGFRPLVVTSGAEALPSARSHELYAVTLDLVMRNEDGWDVLQALRHNPKTAHLPVIVCSVLDQEPLALMLGATAFLKKPVMREELLQALADLTPPHPQVHITQ